MKKALKRSLSLLLAITIIFSSAYVGLSEVDFDGLFVVKAKAALSGTCGNNLTWTLDGDTLTISGRGKMDDYSLTIQNPFYDFRSSVYNLVIDYGVTSIGRLSFSDFENIGSIRIPNTVTSIGDYAFRNCRSLQEIIYLYMDTVTYSLTSIGEGAFAGCDSLTWTSIPGSVKSIGYGAFAFCDNLTCIDVDPGNTKYISDNGVLFNIEKTEIISYPAGKSSSFYYIPHNVTSIGDSAFAGCNNLYSITIPDGITKIGDYAFSHCGNIEGFTIPNTVTSIGVYVFEYCIKLISITIPDSITSIGRSAFERCISLETVTIPDSVTTIDSLAFLECSYLAIKGYRGSYAETYANEKNIEFIPIICTDNDMEHIVGDWIIDKDSSCTVSGSKHIECTVCGEIVETVEIPATGHNYIDVVEVPATCTVPGKMVSTCQNCGDSYETSIVGEHRRAIATIDPTCDEAGKTGEWCVICYQFIGVVTEIPARGHTAGDWIFDKYVTCTTGGSKHKECIRCGEVLEAVTYPATGHTTGHWIIDLEPTVNTPGEQHKECIECGKVVETATIPQLKPATPKVSSTNAINGIQLSWNKVTGAVKYNVYRRKGGESSFTYIGTTTSTTFLDKNVKSGQYYCYTVRAYNSAGGYSAYVYANTNTRKYMETPKLTTIYNHQNGLAIKWNAVAGVTNGYRVYRRGAGSTSWTYLGTTKNLYFIDSAVKNKNGEYYRYTVIADGGYHSKFDTTGLYLRRLANPTLNSATSSSAGITVKWGKVAGSSGYYVYRKTANSTWTRIAVVKGVNSASYLDKTAKKGTTYTYTVRAVYGNTLSSYYSGISCKDKY